MVSVLLLYGGGDSADSHGQQPAHLKGENMLKKSLVVVAGVAVGVWLAAIISMASEAGGNKVGEAEFKEHCVMCHPDGGNIINPQKTLHKKDLEANNVKTPDDIVKIIRNPGPGMPKFDESAISADEAKEISEYILATFK